MTAEKLMNAISEISQRHIDECVIVKPLVHKSMWFKALSIAACLCIIMSVFVIPKLFQKEENSSHSINVHEIVWAAPEEQENIGSYFELSTHGSIIITDALKEKMVENNNQTTLFAVTVTETTGKSTEYIYSSFIESLNVREEYIEQGIIFVTENEIYSLKCPPDLAIVLSLAVKCNE